MYQTPVIEATKAVGDVLSVGVVAATLAQILPSIAALFTIAWTGIRIYESVLNIRQKRRELANMDEALSAYREKR